MAVPVRQQILEAAQSLFQAITVANGYYTTIQRVYITREVVDQVDEHPAIVIVDQGDGPIRRSLKRTYEKRLRLEIRGFSREGDKAERTAAEDQLVADIQKCIAHNEDWLGLAIRTELVETAPGSNELASPRIYARVAIEILYREEMNDPSAPGNVGF